MLLFDMHFKNKTKMVSYLLAKILHELTDVSSTDKNEELSGRPRSENTYGVQNLALNVLHKNRHIIELVLVSYDLLCGFQLKE